ncbi:MAG: tRNA pseudouridine(38-40) synthase TruA [Alphaproteobacteria bacterium]|nr:tRNA pseudouridine(38-40) synthase TruA [Alphaproteobacteria bacterium]
MTQRWKLTVEYDGTHFSGWQRQENAYSVQECLEDAIHAFSGEDVRAHVAGRTDAGVHAVGQVAHVDLEKDVDEKTMRDASNFHMRPHAAAVVTAERVSQDFHARFSAQKRYYCYKIIMGRRADTVLFANRVWHVGFDLDLSAMNEAARHLLGAHDFSSFRDAECQAKSPLRSIDRLEAVEVPGAIGEGRHVEIWAEAKSFLHHQVRNIVGTLEMVGQGKREPGWVREVLEAKDRTKAGPTAPACGLYFVKVDYPPETA